MKVSLNNPIKPIERAAKKLAKPNTEPQARPQVTELDKHCFRYYVDSMKHRSGITHQEIKEIFSKDGDEFLEACLSFGMEKAGIPPNLRIGARFTEDINPEFYMGYIAGIEEIRVSTACKNLTKPQIFGMIRHEIQHYKQNLDVYRHETLGKEAIQIYSRSLTNKDYIDSVIEKSDDELRAIGIVSDDAIKQMRELKAFRDSNPKQYEEMFKTQYKNNVDTLTKFREAIISEMGEIKANSPEGKRAELYFEDFKAQGERKGYTDNNGKVDTNKYFNSITEQEALQIGNQWEADTTPKCQFGELKRFALKALEEYSKKI